MNCVIVDDVPGPGYSNIERPIDSFGMAPILCESVRRIGDVKQLSAINRVDNYHGRDND